MHAVIAFEIPTSQQKSKALVGGKCGGGPPDPIPNSEVKPSSVDGTAWETVWESRSLPTIFSEKPVNPLWIHRLFWFLAHNVPPALAAKALPAR